MKTPKLNNKRSRIAKLNPEPTPKEAIEAIAPSENNESAEPKKSAYQKEAEKVTGTLQDLKDDKQKTTDIFSRIYSMPSEDKMNRSKVAKLTGQVPSTVNVYGSHYPVVRMMKDGKTLLLHTSNYGNDGKTTQLVDKIQQDLPNVFPDAHVIEIHHPDYRHSAKVMRIRDEQNIHRYLEDASQNHPDENYRQHALESLNHLRGMKKAEYSKPIHAKRTATEGYDYEKNVSGRLDRLHQYLSKIGLTPLTDSNAGRKLGAETPTSITINPEGDPHDQQTLHEAAHAMLTPAGKTLGEYQTFIGKPGFEGKLQASAHRKEMQEMHGGGMPEQTAQQMEAGIARRAGIEPFRSPKRGTKPTSAEEGARAHAKKTLNMYDQGLQAFDPFTGQNELGSGIDAVINAKVFGDEDLKNRIREKFKQHKLSHQDLEESLAASEKDVIYKSIVDEMFDVLVKGSLQSKTPFNPMSAENQKTIEGQRRWTHSEIPEARNRIPEMDKNARIRAFNKLHKQTEVRRHPETGERMFLMHRGVGQDEYDTKHNHETGMSNYQPNERTSWTPKFNVARDMINAVGGRNNVISAWIPESSLIHSVGQFNTPRNKVAGKLNPNSRSVTEMEEKEWIVNHDKPFHHANVEGIYQELEPDTKINEKVARSSDKSNFKAKSLQAGKPTGFGFSEPKGVQKPKKLPNKKTSSWDNINKEALDKLASSEKEKVLNEEELPKVRKPFRSQAQRGYLYSHPEKIGGKKALKEWESKTPKNIPKKIAKRDMIAGGLADDKKPSEFDKKKLKAGAKVEREHTKNPKIAQEIAMDHITEDKDYYKKLKTVEKYEIPRAVKGAGIALVMASAHHQMGVESQQPKEPTREVASVEKPRTPEETAYENAYDEGMKIKYGNEFERHPSKVLVRETIKKHPDLSASHGYMLKLSPNAFKETIEHNKPLLREVASRHYDHLKKIFGNDQDKIDRAWYSSQKAIQEEKLKDK